MRLQRRAGEWREALMTFEALSEPQSSLLPRAISVGSATLPTIPPEISKTAPATPHLDTLTGLDHLRGEPA